MNNELYKDLLASRWDIERHLQLCAHQVFH